MSSIRRLVLALLLLPATARADRLFTSGMETNDSTNTEWTAVTGTPTFVTSGTTAPHSGSYSIELVGSANQQQIRRDLDASLTSGTIYVRDHIKYSSITTADAIQAFAESSGGVNSWEVRISDISSNKRFRLRNVPTATNSDCSNNLSSGTFYRWEVRHLISDTVGEVELRVYTGDSTSADCTVQIGTANTDTLGTNVRRIILGWDASQTATVYHDDIAVNDTAGSFQTSWPGPGKVALMKPASNDTVTWAKTGANCSGTTEADCVDDEPGAPDGDTGHNLRTAANSSDRFNSTTLSGPDSDDDIILVHLWGMIGGTSTTGTNTARLDLWDGGGTLRAGPTQAWCDRVGYPTTTTAANAWMFVFDTGADTKSTVESYDLGYESVSLAQSCKATSIWANVEWIDATAASCTNFISLLGAGCK